MNDNQRIVDIQKFIPDIEIEKSLRPTSWDEYIGQDQIKKNLRVFIDASKKRNEAIDHILFYGPPGLGKTTIANLIAYQMNAQIKTTAAPMIEKKWRFGSITYKYSGGGYTFIDEIHRMSSAIEEILYPAMEDFRLDIIIGSGPAAQTIKIDLPRFTLIGATTRAGMLSAPLRERFGMHFRMQFYNHKDLAQIIGQASTKLNKKITKEASLQIAQRSRGTPRIALRLLKRVRDFAEVENLDEIDLQISKFALNELGVDEVGFDEQDIKLLDLLISNQQKPMGLSTIAAALSEDEGTIEDVIEPFLLANGFIERTAKGRIATDKTYLHFGIKQKSFTLFGDDNGMSPKQ